ncbi:serine/threonine-protein kinase [Mycobacterium sp. DL592]|uniref:serine/threonine-protein kinase n=1 Tax=Mycobacterium sp. DL592 TaxID=2675524 RepID=UPI0014244A86|nr:serine/threonine-protein kinase [Mycobacterium sp. DL592]
MYPTTASTVGPGTRVDGYVVESVIGSGAMGTVCVARHADSGMRVALKVLNAEVSGDPAYRLRFTEEARWAQSLQHPNVVAVYDYDETPAGILWMAMHYVPGTDADRELRAGRMPPQRAAHVISQVAAALDYAHSHGVVHGDVKPSNFLFGQGDRVLLADFGLARSTGDGTPTGRDGVVLASAAYASPEMLRGQTIDRRSDVYSLGASLFRLLTGKPPFFDAGSKDAVVQSHLYRTVPRVTELAPWLPAEMDDVILTAMAKDPAARYRCAGELAAAVLAVR